MDILLVEIDRLKSELKLFQWLRYLHHCHINIRSIYTSVNTSVYTSVFTPFIHQYMHQYLHPYLHRFHINTYINIYTINTSYIHHIYIIYTSYIITCYIHIIDIKTLCFDTNRQKRSQIQGSDDGRSRPQLLKIANFNR